VLQSQGEASAEKPTYEELEQFVQDLKERIHAVDGDNMLWHKLWNEPPKMKEQALEG